MQCGIACLKMICRYYHKIYSLEYFSKICGSTTEGVSMLSIKKTASNIGLESECGKIALNSIKRINSPCILHWNQNHFVVLYKVKKGKTFYIADPAKGLVKYNLDEFKKHWISIQSDGEEKGIAMFLEPTPDFYTNNIAEESIKEERSSNFSLATSNNTASISVQIVFGLARGPACCNSFYHTHPVHCGCRHQKPEHRLYLVDTLRATDAHC